MGGKIIRQFRGVARVAKFMKRYCPRAYQEKLGAKELDNDLEKCESCGCLHPGTDGPCPICGEGNNNLGTGMEFDKWKRLKKSLRENVEARKSLLERDLQGHRYANVLIDSTIIKSDELLIQKMDRLEIWEHAERHK